MCPLDAPQLTLVEESNLGITRMQLHYFPVMLITHRSFGKEKMREERGESAHNAPSCPVVSFNTDQIQMNSHGTRTLGLHQPGP
jgi:hypothetical protein